MQLDDAILARGSVKAYDPAHEIDDDELRAIFRLVLRSPSSFNMQNWRFVCVRDGDIKARLMEASYKQAHIGQASVDVVVCGDLMGHERAAEAWADAPLEVQQRLVPMIGGFYAKNEQLRRDEAIRSGSLAAMTLMLVAQSRGLSTCPMIGFDPKRVCEVLGIPDTWLPVMLVTLGKGTTPARPSSRFPMEQVVRLDGFDGAGLGG
ncbi:MAG: nitroreductase family protein [Planctomycetes bacterium]|nr:nitroreductase family protein [Planctomycetota bacterium]